MAESTISAGHVLVGRYRLETQLGQGGMGTIWRAQHLVLNAPIAVKVIDRTVVPDEETLSRFIREAQSAASLRSPHVVQILDYGVDGKVPFIAMELLEGENLAQRIKRVKRLTPAETARVISHIGRALSRAHEAGIVHRDIKPDNIFLIRNEDEEIAKVLDFGVAKVERNALSEGTRTRTGSVLGTPFYMSPEQAQGNRTVDSRSDLWSMGVIAFECLTGKRPFYSDGLGDLVLAICVRDIPVPSEIASVPLGFDEWWHRAVARDPEKRFQSAKELADALREALGLEPREVLRESPQQSPDVEILSVSPDTDRDSKPLADEHALTLAVVSAPEVAVLTERQFGTTQKSPPVPALPSSSGLGVVLGVAAAALFVGLLAGVAVLRSGRAGAEADPRRALPTALPAAARQPSEPKIRPKPLTAPSSSAPLPLLEFLPGDEPAREASPVAPLSGDSPTTGKSASAPHSGSAAPGLPSEPPDAGWVKPSWAIPDPEPVRRQPIEE